MDYKHRIFFETKVQARAMVIRIFNVLEDCSIPSIDEDTGIWKCSFSTEEKISEQDQYDLLNGMPICSYSINIEE